MVTIFTLKRHFNSDLTRLKNSFGQEKGSQVVWKRNLTGQKMWWTQSRKRNGIGRMEVK